eukprot:scaffold49062_cov58-Phaeocystis_antarctica.AAC.2
MACARETNPNPDSHTLPLTLTLTLTVTPTLTPTLTLTLTLTPTLTPTLTLTLTPNPNPDQIVAAKLLVPTARWLPSPQPEHPLFATLLALSHGCMPHGARTPDWQSLERSAAHTLGPRLGQGCTSSR